MSDAGVIFEYRKICDDFSDAIKKFFPNKLIAYAYLSGTFAYGGSIKGKSDIDVTIVFKDSVYLVNPSSFDEQIKLFIENCRLIHHRYGYVLDTTFPGEYITIAQVKDALLGRGFSTNGNGGLFLPKASNDYYLANKEHWFRAWRSSLAFSSFFHGNKELMLQHKYKAWRIIILFLLSQYKPVYISGNSLLERMLENKNKWEGVGVTNRYRLFKEQELVVVDVVLKNLEKEGFLNRKESYEYAVVTKKVADWERRLALLLNSDNLWNAQILLEAYE